MEQRINTLAKNTGHRYFISILILVLSIYTPALYADDEPNYFTITNNYDINTGILNATDLCKIYLNTSGSPTTGATLQYRIITSGGVAGAWNTLPASSSGAPNLKKGEKLQLRGNNPSGFASSTSNYYYLYFKWKSTKDNGAWSYKKSGSSTTTTVVDNLKGVMTFSGDIMSLVAYDSESNTIDDDMQLPDYCFYSFFNGQTLYIGDAGGLLLPATRLSQFCYANLFYNAYNLRVCPKELPATTLANSCYQNMFYLNTNRRAFTKAPDIKATTYTGTTIQETSDNAMFFTASITDANNKLNTMRVYRTTWNKTYSSNWVQGVQTNSGSFYCPPQLERSYGMSYIPQNWTVYSYDLTFTLQSGVWTDETAVDKQYTWRTDKTDVTTFLTNEVAAGTRFYSDAACTTELSQSDIETLLPTLTQTTTKYIYVTGGTSASTYIITYNKGEYGTGNDIADGEKTPGVDFPLSSSTFTRDNYVQTGWSTSDGGDKDYELGGTYTTDADITLYPYWTPASGITLYDDRDNDYYNTLMTDTNGVKAIVTYPRTFTAGRWATICLPFEVIPKDMSDNKMKGRVYSFSYADGSVGEGGINLYFTPAKKMQAGVPYIVNPNADMAAITSFRFAGKGDGVTIDLSKDIVEDLTADNAYDGLQGLAVKTQGTIGLIGTLRNGVLRGTASDNRYMGLKNNHVYYPNVAIGSTIRAYRAIFYSTENLNISQIRIVVDGEDMGALEVTGDGLQPVESVRKYIEDGVLYIERDGIVYNAQGQKVD